MTSSINFPIWGGELQFIRIGLAGLKTFVTPAILETFIYVYDGLLTIKMKI